jgi:hypothetical protein
LPKKTQPIRISEAFFGERSREDGRAGEARVRISIVSGYIINLRPHAVNTNSTRANVSTQPMSRFKTRIRAEYEGNMKMGKKV